MLSTASASFWVSDWRDVSVSIDCFGRGAKVGVGAEVSCLVTSFGAVDVAAGTGVTSSLSVEEIAMVRSRLLSLFGWVVWFLVEGTTRSDIKAKQWQREPGKSPQNHHEGNDEEGRMFGVVMSETDLSQSKLQIGLG